VEVHLSRASAVIVQRIAPDSAAWFLDWQRGIDDAARQFAGYRGSDVYPPSDGQSDQYVVVIHFDNETSLQQWLGSPLRAEWVAKLRARAGDFDLQALPGGFGAWFTGQSRKGQAPPPPAWKMVVTVVLGLFPTVMLLAIFPGPYTARLGFAASMLIGNFLSVSILQWVVMPALTKALGPWLRANGDKQRAFSVVGTLLILLVLVGLVFVFRMLRIGEA
jgi:antibiotic biosynthesis monooxygenase (ABM) superfamily enzyme